MFEANSDENGYVQKGLVFHLDGIDWGGVEGHWIELKNGYDWYEVNGINLHTENDAMVFSGSEYMLTSDTIPSYSATTHTIEVCMNRHYNRAGMINFGNNKVSCWVDNANHIAFSTMSNAPCIKSTTEALVSYSAFNGLFYRNGTNIESTGTISAGTAQKNSKAILGKTYESGYNFNGRMYSIRIYDRQLTEDEIQHNYEIDRIRFNFPQ